MSFAYFKLISEKSWALCCLSSPLLIVCVFFFLDIFFWHNTFYLYKLNFKHFLNWLVFFFSLLVNITQHLWNFLSVNPINKSLVFVLAIYWYVTNYSKTYHLKRTDIYHLTVAVGFEFGCGLTVCLCWNKFFLEPASCSNCQNSVPRWILLDYTNWLPMPTVVLTP